MVAESRSQSLSCGGKSEPDAGSHKPHCVLTIPLKPAALCASASGTVGRGINDTPHGSQGVGKSE